MSMGSLRPQPVSLTEPPDEAAWHLCREQYEASGDFEEDARDWVGSCEDLDDDQIATIREWYGDSKECQTRIEDHLAGEA